MGWWENHQLVNVLLFFYNGETVDGSDIRRSPVDMVDIPLFLGVLSIPGG